jgi:PAS domain-containing protein
MAPGYHAEPLTGGAVDGGSQGPTVDDDDLKLAYEALADTTDELELSNADLGELIEQLRRADEELQVAAAHVDALNVELAAAEADLGAADDELRTRGEAIGRLSAVLESLLGQMATPAVVIGTDGKVLAWSRGAAELWGRPAAAAVGRKASALGLGLPESLTARLDEDPTPRSDAFHVGGDDRTRRATAVPAVSEGGRLEAIVVVVAP